MKIVFDTFLFITAWGDFDVNSLLFVISVIALECAAILAAHAWWERA